MKPKLVWTLVLGISLANFGLAGSQTKILGGVIVSGGGAANDSSFRLVGTVGQPALGASGGSATAIAGGFWALGEITVTDVEQFDANSQIPGEFRLYQNYPNPFNPTTTIAFALPEKSKVTLTIYDLNGGVVAALVDEEKPPGEYRVTFEAQGFPSGIYFYAIQIRGDGASFRATKKIILLK